MAHRILRDVEADGWERSDFPIICESCLGDNPYVRMTKANYDKECKICTRPFTVFRWRPGRDARYKKSEICQTCSKLKNVCQVCLLDLEYGLPVQVRDTALSINSNDAIPKSDVNREYFAEEHDRRARAGLDYESSYGKERPNDTILKLQRTTPYYKRNRAHICSFFIRGECTRGAECPYRHEMPVTGELSQQNIKDRYYGVNDPVALKLLNKAGEMPSLEPPEDESIRTLYVGGLDARVSEQDLRDHFYSHGEIESVKMVLQRACAFVAYTTREGAEKAAEELSNRLVIKGLRLKLMWGRPQAPKVDGEPGSDETRQQAVAHSGLLPRVVISQQQNQFQPPGTSASQDHQPPPHMHYFNIPPPPLQHGRAYYPSMDPQRMGAVSHSQDGSGASGPGFVVPLLIDSSSTLYLVNPSTTVTMSDAGERTCPLCAEEMDLTDQQLKPCKCGYDICVWCWHHIMDMSEKDNTEGRCPACRTPYNKEKIVGTASKCDRLVTGMNMEKKQKSQKGKTKTSEGRKELGSVRVIQRNLVYIVGLPLNLADEDLLQQKEYFGQYGKVLKVSISRTAAGEIQQFPNSTCSVYITYSKEEEAVRSIQSAHGFILEGRPLRACFGTTKYCHAWLRNTPCTNADCLYLHEFGPQEDSFTKDEVVSAFTRNKVQQITGATNDMQRRSGNFLPPPADDFSKPISKATTNNPANTLKVSPPNSSCGRSVTLPAAASWGTRASTSHPIVANGASTTLSKKHCEQNHDLQEKGNLGNLTSVKKTVGLDDRTSLCKTLVTTGLSSSSTASIHLSTTPPDSKNISLETTNKNQTPQPHEDLHTVTSTRKESDLVSDLQKKVSQVAINNAEEQNLPHIMDPTSLDQNTERAPQPPDTYNRVFEDHCTADLDLGENTIISNILSMDFDPWDESLTSPQNLAKFLGENNKQVLSSRKPQNSNQSRFSFARQDDCTDQGLNYAPSLGDFGRGVEYNNNSIYYDNKLSNSNGFSSFSFEKSDHFAVGYPETKISVLRTQVSAPPGFSGPSRAPPPGFTLNNTSGNHNFDTLRKSHEVAATVNIGDLELMDPAILAVGGRVPMRSNFPTHTNSFENDTRLQFLMQSAFSHQNPRFTDNYQQTSFQRQMSSSNVNGYWNGGNDRMGFSRYYSGHEDTKFQLSTSADLYNKTFGI